MRIVLLAVLVTLAGACANDVTSPRLQPAPENSVTGTGESSRPWVFGRRGFGMGFGPMMFAARRLPENLKLTDAQRTQIKSLVTAYRAAHKDDLNAVGVVAKQAFAARESGMKLSVDQRRALFAQVAPARQRLMAANKQLRADVEQVLTTEQRSWLTAHRPTRSLRRRSA